MIVEAYEMPDGKLIRRRRDAKGYALGKLRRVNEDRTREAHALRASVSRMQALRADANAWREVYDLLAGDIDDF